jgi:hypothetical protein
VDTDQRYLNRAEAAEFLSEFGYKTAKATLAKLAVVGGGPPFLSWGRQPLYRPSDLLAWAETRCNGPRRSTSEPFVRQAKSAAASELNDAATDHPRPPCLNIALVDSEPDHSRDESGRFSTSTPSLRARRCAGGRRRVDTYRSAHRGDPVV